MKTPIDIRSVEPDELSALRTFAAERFYESFGALNSKEDMEAYIAQQFTQEQINKEYANPNSTFFFAKKQKEIIGYLKLNIGEAQTDQPLVDALEIERIYVKARHQNRQIGQQLLDFALAWTSKNGIHKVWLGVWERNESAIRFYTRNGFVQFGSHEFLLGRDKQRDVLMQRAVV